MAIEDRTFIRDWLVRMSLSIPAAADIADLASRIDQIADLLVAKVPPSLFTTDSLEFCLRRFKFFPSYAELWGRIQTYQREQLPKLKAIAAPDAGGQHFDVDPNLPASARALVIVWLKDHAAGIRSASDMAVSLSVMRRYAPQGYQWLIKGDLRAAEIAVRERWMDAEHRWSPPSEVEKDAVSAIARQVYASVEMRTPDPQPPSHVVPPSPPPRPAGTPPPEHIQARRLDNPLLRPIAEREATREAERKLSEAAAATAEQARAGDDDWTPSYLRVVP